MRVVSLSPVSSRLAVQAQRNLSADFIPQRIVGLSCLPLTASNKVDYRRLLLLAKDVSTDQTSAAYIAEEVVTSSLLPDDRLEAALTESLISFPNITPLYNQGSKRIQLLLLFAVTRVSIQYRSLAQHLRLYEVIGVDNIQIDQPSAYSCISAMVRDHAALIRRKQPRGPSNECGFSFGGLVAWSVAAHLEKEGETVRLIPLDSEALVTMLLHH